MGSAQLGYPDEQDEAGLRVVGVLVALICALLNLSFIHSGTGISRSMFVLQCLERYDCFTDLVWMPEPRYMNK